MQTKAILDKELLLEAPARGGWGALPRPGPLPWRPGIRLLAGLSALALVPAGCWAAWHFGGWPGLAVAAGVLALAGLLATAWLMAEVGRNQREIERFIAELSPSDRGGVAPADFRLGPAWACVAERVAEHHTAMAAQVRELHQAGQRSEVALRVAQAAQRQAEAIVGSLCDAVIVTNSFGEVVLANPEAERVFQVELAGVRGKSVRQALGHPTLAHMIEQAAERSSAGRRFAEELSIACNGRPHWFKVTTAAVLGAGSENMGTLAVLRDITPEKAAHSRSAEFVSAVSHEIKTPLASVKACAEMLADGEAKNDPEAQHRFLSIIESQTDRMSRMLENMLDMARIESGVVRVEKRCLSLNELVDSGVRLMQPAASDKGLSIESRLSSMYLAVEMDPDMMSRVVMNLVSNAIKYTDAGGHIVVRSRMLQDQASFEVEDTGHGIPREAMAKLFTKFYRVKENTKVAAGTGLGLALVKHIVEEVHGGRVEVESEAGKGSTFRVNLPLARTS